METFATDRPSGALAPEPQTTVPVPSRAPLFRARGPLSTLVLGMLARPHGPASADEQPHLLAAAIDAIARTDDVVRDDDIQLTLLVLYGLSYGGVVDNDDGWEWDADLIGVRTALERAFETALREEVPRPLIPVGDAGSVAEALFAMTAPDSGPGLSRYIAKQAIEEQLIEFVVQRSVYTLKEADAHSWAIPRLKGRAKAALVEIQADEYGGGNPARVHQVIFAGTMRALGLDDRYGAYVDSVPAITLASFNMMTMFGFSRRLRGALVGHLAAFEMTSSIPCRLYGNGFRRLGFGTDVTWYFDEHVEADAVHEQIAGRDLAGSLAEDEPELLGDIMFGASACLTIDGSVSRHILDSWTAGTSSLRVPLP